MGRFGAYRSGEPPGVHNSRCGCPESVLPLIVNCSDAVVARPLSATFNVYR
jgi:hypothetical protein